MTTATGTSLSDLVAEADELLQKRAEIMARIRDMADAEAGNFQVGSTVATTAAPPAKRRGRPPGSSSASASASTTPKKRGPKPGKKSGGKVKPNERNYSNKISLREAIWQVLDQGPEQWAKTLPDFPEDAEGLTVSEVREIIEETGIWQSSSDNITPQVQQQLYKLKEEGKIARGGDRRYYIVEGAEL